MISDYTSNARKIDVRINLMICRVVYTFLRLKNPSLKLHELLLPRLVVPTL